MNTYPVADSYHPPFQHPCKYALRRHYALSVPLSYIAASVTLLAYLCHLHDSLAALYDSSCCESFQVISLHKQVFSECAVIYVTVLRCILLESLVWEQTYLTQAAASVGIIFQAEIPDQQAASHICFRCPFLVTDANCNYLSHLILLSCSYYFFPYPKQYCQIRAHKAWTQGLSREHE